MSEKNGNIKDILALLEKEYGGGDSYGKTAAPKAEAPKAVNTPDPERVNASRRVAEPENRDVPRIHSTYVPRFTDASATYRMSDDPRPASSYGQVPTRPAYTPSVSIDPTSELHEDRATPAVTLNVKSYGGEEEDTSTVFKFKGENAPEAEKAEPDPVKEELGFTVEELVNGRPAPEPELPEEPEIPEELPEEPEEEYQMPDPVETSIVGYSSAKPAEHVNTDEAPEHVGDKIDSTKKRAGNDYTAYVQRDGFKDMFLDSILSVNLRFYASLLISLVLLLAENLSLFGVDIVSLLGMEHIRYQAPALIDIMFIAALYILAIPEVITSVRCLFAKKAVPELVYSVSFIVLMAYTVVMCATASYQPYPVFGFIFAISTLIIIRASYYKKCADFTSFKVISINGEKHIIDRKFTRMLERENVALDGLVEEHKSKTARMFRTAFVSDFFKRTSPIDENTGHVLLTLAVSFAVAVICAVVAAFVPGGLIAAFSAFTLVFIFSAPAFAALVHKLPYFHAMTESTTEKSAVIGETAFYEYADVDVVTFNDTEVFGKEDVNLQRVMLYGNSENLSKALRQMAALFMNVGGPLDYLFSNSLDRKCPPASNPYMEKDGVFGEIDGHTVCGGTLEFMRRHGVTIPEETGKSSAPTSASTKIMYVAEDGVVYAKFHIRYSFSEEFTMILPILQEEGIIPLVYTRDPNITPELIDALTAGADRIRILRKENSPENDDPIFTRLSAGLVTLGNKMNAINMLLLSRKYVRFQNGINMIEMISLVIGALISLVLSIAGITRFIPTAFLAIWPIIWWALIYLISKNIFHIKKKKKQ